MHHYEEEKKKQEVRKKIILIVLIKIRATIIKTIFTQSYFKKLLKTLVTTKSTRNLQTTSNYFI